MMKSINISGLLAFIAFLAMFMLSACNIEYHVNSNKTCVKDLDGLWKFALGDDSLRAKPEFNDSAWDEINVPMAWEDDGYVGYDGFAWYRTKFILPSYLKNEQLFLGLAQIDDVDETYLNGHRIGGLGTFPPNYKSAYNEDRRYYIPKEFLNIDGENIIAVRVFDERQTGGIVNGQVGIYGYRDMPEMLVSMEGLWKFHKDDELSWANPKFDDSNWATIYAPDTWESQGYCGYDGFAWYRLQFEMPSAKDDDLIMMLGNIDDIDQVYLNGKLIGSTGDFSERIWRKNSENWDKYWAELRGYEIPKGLLVQGGKNVIAVRVFDQRGYGGIYNGPLGILSNKEYKKYKRRYENHTSSSGFFISTKHLVIDL